MVDEDRGRLEEDRMLEEGNALIGWVHVAVPCPLGSLRPRPRSQPPRPLPSICEHALLLSETQPVSSYGSPQRCRSNSPSYPFLRPTVLSVRYSEGGACQSQAEPPVRAPDDQHTGPGPGTLEAQVCLLDPGAAHRGPGGGEGALGRADGEPGAGYVGEFAVDEGGLVVGLAEYIEDGPLSSPPWYLRHHEEVLGDVTEEEDGLSSYVQRCFNCGTPGHIVSACPQRVDHDLVALSRQMYNFFHKSGPGRNMRVHEVVEWRNQRLQWLDKFEPGEIKGPLLRDALGLRDGDPGERVPWLSKISSWGYPPGWISPHDPRKRVWELLTDADGEADEECDFMIVSDGGEELLKLHCADAVYDEKESSGDVDAQAETPKRWATYPNTYFLWSKLPVCPGLQPQAGVNGRSSPLDGSTFSVERQALWESIVAGVAPPLGHANHPPPEPAASPPPAPPPPSSSPPPLPPTTYAPPPPPSTPFLHSQVSHLPTTDSSDCDQESEEDMDLSD
ncbi:hypothetical protein VTO73DRAFT_13014 [Trametes versicolor]